MQQHQFEHNIDTYKPENDSLARTDKINGVARSSHAYAILNERSDERASARRACGRLLLHGLHHISVRCAAPRSIVAALQPLLSYNIKSSQANFRNVTMLFALQQSKRKLAHSRWTILIILGRGHGIIIGCSCGSHAAINCSGGARSAVETSGVTVKMPTRQ